MPAEGTVPSARARGRRLTLAALVAVALAGVRCGVPARQRAGAIAGSRCAAAPDGATHRVRPRAAAASAAGARRCGSGTTREDAAQVATLAAGTRALRRDRLDAATATASASSINGYQLRFYDAERAKRRPARSNLSSRTAMPSARASRAA